MTKIVLADGTEEFLSPGEARKKVGAGEATFAQLVPMYTTRQMVAETPTKTRRKRRTKAEMAKAEPDEAE